MRIVFSFCAFLCVALAPAAEVPVKVGPLVARHGIVVAGHPRAAAAGLEVLKAGGNAIDAAIATSLALGVAEPYASGLGGKIVLVYFDAKTRATSVVDALDVSGATIDVARERAMPVDDHSYGYASVCVPGLAAGLWEAHRKWGTKPWPELVAPAIGLARDGVELLPQARDLFEEQTKKLHRGDPEIARWYLAGGELPATGAVLKNEDLARTLEMVARDGRDGFYRGAIADAIVQAVQRGGGALTRDDFARYEPRLTTPVEMAFRGYWIASAPPPASGSLMIFAALTVLENESFDGGPLRTAGNLARLGRVWREVEPLAYRTIGDGPAAPAAFQRALAPEAIAQIRARALPAPPPVPKKDGQAIEWPRPFETAMAATTHFIVVDAAGDVVCATQSLSTHFGAGVIAPGTGVVLNDSMSNFNFTDPADPGFVAPGRRPRSTISPTIVFSHDRPILALGAPGSATIPTAIAQVLLDRLVLGRPLADAIGDTRVHFNIPWRAGQTESLEAEDSLPAGTIAALAPLGWPVALREAAGRGRHFGGVNAVEINADGTLTGFADPRRTNRAAGF
ncbi:MAG TPA: gamma-glutamyltransferase [Opitutaceae bacterium]|nr:gamma-glutamyltransferase [Opitutaceae bacterium]